MGVALSQRIVAVTDCCGILPPRRPPPIPPPGIPIPPIRGIPIPPPPHPPPPPRPIPPPCPEASILTLTVFAQGESVSTFWISSDVQMEGSFVFQTSAAYSATPHTTSGANVRTAQNCIAIGQTVKKEPRFRGKLWFKPLNSRTLLSRRKIWRSCFQPMLWQPVPALEKYFNIASTARARWLTFILRSRSDSPNVHPNGG